MSVPARTAEEPTHRPKPACSVASKPAEIAKATKRCRVKTRLAVSADERSMRSVMTTLERWSKTTFIASSPHRLSLSSRSMPPPLLQRRPCSTILGQCMSTAGRPAAQRKNRSSSTVTLYSWIQRSCRTAETARLSIATARQARPKAGPPRPPPAPAASGAPPWSPPVPGCIICWISDIFAQCSLGSRDCRVCVPTENASRPLRHLSRRSL
mmetsp:Transcript_42263/g.119486  ORF Transcript_42263/g.119486 Transcript_42263/m.119486 type:complete len:211 (-) Transcript_42263:72-704(-)